MKALINIFAFLVIAMTHRSRGDVISDCSGKPADVIFVLDASNSIWRPDFDRQLNFIKDVVEFFSIGSRNMMVGVVTYARHPQLQFSLNSYDRKSDLFAAIDNIRQDGGYETRTSEALRYLRERAFSEYRGARGHVAKVAVIITDGRSVNTSLSALEAAKVKASGVHLFAVGVGRNLDMEELRSLASDPSDFYTFLVDNYSGLERIKNLLAIKTCTVTDPPSTTTTTTTTTTPSTTTIVTSSATITSRPRRIKATTKRIIIATTTSETTTRHTDNDDDDSDDEHGSDDLNGESKGRIVDPKRNENKNNFGENTDKSGQKNFSGGSEFAAGKEPTGTGTGNLDFASEKYRSTLEEVIIGRSTPGIGAKDLQRPTIRFETPRTPEILEPPIYVPFPPVPDSLHELRAKNVTHLQLPEHLIPDSSEHERGTDDEREANRKKSHPGPTDGSEDGDESDGRNGKNPGSRDREVGIYEFDDDGRFVRREGSESLVDLDQLPKVPEDGELYEEGGLIFSQDILGRRRIIGCVINGTHYIGKWMADDGKRLWYGYRAPEIADRVRIGTRHVIESADRRHHASTPGQVPDGYSVVLPGGDEDHVDSEEVQILDPNGRPGYWEIADDGQMVWYLFTCPGVYVPVPDGPPLDENGRPRLNGHSQCAGQDENGQDVEYVYVSRGQFEKVTVAANSGGPTMQSDIDEAIDEDRYESLRGREETRWENYPEPGTGFGQDGLENPEVNWREQPGVWTVDVNGTLIPIKNELVDLELPKIDEEQEFFVKENVIWTKGKGGKLRPVGCIVNGTYYVGYWIRKDDGSRLLFGYPSKTLQQRLSHREPSELTHVRLRERLPAVEHEGEGHWVVDEHGVLTWYARVTDGTSHDKLQEFRIKDRDDDKLTEPDGEPGQDDLENPTSEEEENADRQRIVVDSNGQQGVWRRDEKGGWVWYQYVCPGVYEPVPEGSRMEDPLKECSVVDEDGKVAIFEYHGPGIFKKVPKGPGTGKENEKNRTDNQTKDSKSSRESQGQGQGQDENRTKHGRTRAADSEVFHGKTTARPVPVETETTKRTKSTSLNKHESENGGKSPSRRVCRPRKPTDLAFIIDSKGDDETSGDRMWNLIRDILSKLDLDDDRIHIRFIEECGPGTSGLDLGEFDSKDALIRALDATIHAPPTPSAQLIRNMADALSRDHDDDVVIRHRGSGGRKVGVYVTDGSSDELEATVEAAQKAKHDDGVEIIAVGVGPRVNPTELRAIASCEVDRHYYAMNHHSKAEAIARKISKVICLGR